MKDKIDAVKQFHNAFKIGYKETPEADLGIEKNMLRYKLMREENEEYLEAANNNDLVEVADALGDMLYILCGTIIEHGLQYKIEEVFNEIQRSNMSKLAENGEPIYREDGKVLKGPNYFKPDIAKILNN
ncbi:nucleoside triphosphate pyrophosphohydrolase family protein [Yeosuana sp. MJ-SS3]|jgi:predicted HAD superfamily Cof-like phosphohydrolase|uniref:Nucleoside triphosphate pyrophosphohydrolase family protein n=1 Tax=Gilvirhabdus luticola TaxID=3079858 RepID=A0ABU3U6N4_9FLAO|nr:nucleoside triphosphate pyrophosphohydrolase family protein [Yeosuana sp. MJ-SS3]MDU8886069.1 nucleoside triphosphate pyrophosphohydrolase family protein [Yeosuana sp. MJ-SS3]